MLSSRQKTSILNTKQQQENEFSYSERTMDDYISVPMQLYKPQTGQQVSISTSIPLPLNNDNNIYTATSFNTSLSLLPVPSTHVRGTVKIGQLHKAIPREVRGHTAPSGTYA